MLVYGAGGLVAVYLLYRWYRNYQANAAANTNAAQSAVPGGSTGGGGTGTIDTSGLVGVGQEQSDIAALQGQEQQDVAGILGQLSTIQSSQSAAPSQSDLAGVEAQLVGASSQEALDVTHLEQQYAQGLAANQQQFSAFERDLKHVLAGSRKQSKTISNLRKQLEVLRRQREKGVRTAIRGGAPFAHTSQMQAGTPGHVGAHAGGAVAPRSHEPKYTAPRLLPAPTPGSPGHERTGPSPMHGTRPTAPRQLRAVPRPPARPPSRERPRGRR
jgi:hypothetical protein